jgi:hypothetical protein
MTLPKWVYFWKARSFRIKYVRGSAWLSRRCSYTAPQFYIDLLRHEAFPNWVKEVVLRIVPAPPDSEIPHPITSEDVLQPNVSSLEATSLPAVEEQLNLPTVEPERAKMYFDSPEGFGEWRLYFSATSIKDLRKLYKSNQKVFAIVEQKLKSLSQGHFTPSSHKKLKGCDEDCFVYEAKMTSDTRLVYHIGLQTHDSLQVCVLR